MRFMSVRNEDMNYFIYKTIREKWRRNEIKNTKIVLFLIEFRVGYFNFARIGIYCKLENN